MTIFSFSFQNWRNIFKISVSLLKAWAKQIPFSSRKLIIFCLISISCLETGKIDFRFPFLLLKEEKLFSNLSFFSLDFFASHWPRLPVAHSSVISLLKHLKWANNFNAEREKTLSNSHTLPHCHTAILSKLQGYSHNECSSCNNRHQNMKLPRP